jgi:hypothetical protein
MTQQFSAHCLYRDDYCSAQWKVAISRVTELLRDQGMKYIDGIRNFEDFKKSVDRLQQAMGRSASVDESPHILPFIDRLLNSLLSFISLIASYLGGSIVETAIIWGLMSLLIRVILDTLLPTQDGRY